jgi:hypothetical protein
LKTGLTRKQLRSIEREMGVYLDAPVKQLRTPNEQLGVYDEGEMHAGDICADDRYFSEEELRTKIKALF